MAIGSLEGTARKRGGWPRPGPPVFRAIGHAGRIARGLAVEAPDPPRRLPLGEMALEHIRAKLQGQLDQLESWAELSATSDFAGRSAA